MTDRDLAAALVLAQNTEQGLQAHWTASQQDLPERDAALVAGRHATALRRSLETWMALRATRAALKTT